MIRLKIDSLKLLALALLVAIVLCGAEVTFDGRRDIMFSDQFNHIVLSASMLQALSNFNFPPRVSPILSDGIGNPFHQFYSPLGHVYIAIISFILGDVVLGFSVGSVLILAFAFVYMFKLCRYLTLSSCCATVAAFLFVTAPYLSTDRVMRGAFSEYMAFCLLPMTLYYNLRALNLKNVYMWILSVLSTSALVLSHLITGSFFILFYAIFLFLYSIWSFVRRQKQITDVNAGTIDHLTLTTRILKSSRKIIGGGSIAVATVLLCMWYIGPVTFYNDLIMKQMYLIREPISSSAPLTTIIGILSITDTSWNFRANIVEPSRFQIGFLLLASFMGLFFFCFQKRTSVVFPFMIFGIIIFTMIVRPSVFNYPPLKYFDMAQMSYRFLSHFTLIASISSALSLNILFNNYYIVNSPSRYAVSFAIIAMAMIAVLPYLYPKILENQWPKYMVNTKMVYERSKLIYGEDSYLRMPPSESVGIHVWTDPNRKSLNRHRNSKNGYSEFQVDLEEYFRSSDHVQGEVLLNILYYPGLQSVDIIIDGKPTKVGLDTFWQKRHTFGPFNEFDPKPEPFHGLKLSGLPNNGFLEVKVRFTGLRWANLISFLSILFILGTIFYIVIFNKIKTLNS